MSSDRIVLLLVWIGGLALLLAAGVDTVAMFGRHLRVPLLGSIEVVQCAVLVAGSTALLLTTMSNGHARVHLLLDRMSPDVRRRTEVLHGLAGLLFVIALLAGSVWIAADLWHGHEESELLQIPYRPLRIAVVVMLTGLLVVGVRQLFLGLRR